MDRRRFLIAGGVGSLATVALPSSAEPAFAAQESGISGVSGASGALRITAGFLGVGLDGTGRVTGLVDLRNGTDYLAADRTGPLVSVVLADGQQEVPTRVRVSRRDPRVLVFSSARVTVEVRVTAHATYSTLEVVDLSAAPGVEVQTLLWGPLASRVNETVGEGVGVVGDSRFVLGIHPLNDKTVGAWPKEFAAFGFGADVEAKPYGQSGTQNDWSAGAKTSWGGILRAYTYDYTKARIRDGQIPTGPLAGSEAEIVGSGLAVYGSAPDLVLTVLSQVAQAEKLAYPTIDGQWQKVAEATRQPFLTLHDLSTTNLAAAVAFAEQAGIRNVYSVESAAGPWKSTGHYEFNGNFGGSDATATRMARTAAASGIRVGVHTLSNFIAANDPYVEPAPADERFTTGKTVKLTRPLAAADTTLYADGDSGGGGYVLGRRLRLGDEFVTFSGVTRAGDGEWQFTDVKRAQWGSAAASCPKGADAVRTSENQYGGARGDLPIIDEIASRLATVCNTTGIRNISFDGLEEVAWNGWSGQGFAHMINGFHRRLKSQDNFIAEASNPSTNSWQAQSRVSWGGIGWSDSNYDQMSRNVGFYRANYLPLMGGSLPIGSDTKTLDVETNLARGASLGVNFGWFETSMSSLSQGGNTQAVLAAVKTWNAAIAAGAFTSAQRQLMADQGTYWHLSEEAEGKRWSLQETDADGNPVGSAQTVRAPRPGFVTAAPPEAKAGELYAFKVTSSTPQTVGYEITSGALPNGLTLNKDTGGITGVPTGPGARTFTITARGGAGVPDAAVTYRMNVSENKVS
ncbi:Ig domain-containing protein [Streptomyces sp. NBC_01020]|uniref:Ig domain-containing protein n=1 Tax=Streptomyces sp. NBC_01020 TaxID=2903722 RepID=UPI0038650E34|nr:Ig domain-containing protein [Streptomyces sp. NBC_01020]